MSEITVPAWIAIILWVSTFLVSRATLGKYVKKYFEKRKNLKLGIQDYE